jgi:CRISPR-associated protein (TIGR02710 family)
LPGDARQVRAVGAVTGSHRPVVLICTVGGSPQPIATALRELRPDAVWFLVSDGKAGESSLSQVESDEIDYDKARGIRGPGLRFVDGCPNEEEAANSSPKRKKVNVVEIPADNPDAAYKSCRSLLAEVRRQHKDHRVITDYTGGTKSMSAALLMAAFAQPGVEVQFMVGERPDLNQVRSGSERPQLMPADFIVAERDFVAAEQAVAGYDYAAAEMLLWELRERLNTLATKPPKAFGRRLEEALRWTGVMAHWDAFAHREAAQRARGPVREMLEASGHLEPLLALSGREKGRPGWDICADLWLNALRRGERGRYDDAVARLYRLVEAAAQVQLWVRHGLESGCIAPEQIPDHMRPGVYVKTDPKTGTEYAQLGLDSALAFLRHRDANDDFVAAWGQGPAWLAKRNNSILAHGFVRVDQEAWEEAKTWVEAHVLEFFRGTAFQQLPREIPHLQDRDVLAGPAAQAVPREKIDAAIRILAEAARPARIILFGSYARGDAREESDLDLLVIEPRVDDRAREMVRLRRLLRPLRVPADVLVYSADEVARWGNQPGSVLYWALREGTVVHD